MYLPYLLKKYFKQSEPAEVSVVTTEMSMIAKEEYSDERCEDEADFLEISPGYLPEESVHYMTSGSNLIEELQAEFMDLVHQFFKSVHQSTQLSTTNLVQHHDNKLRLDQPVPNHIQSLTA